MPLKLEDIASITGLSRSTISRVINGAPDVNEQTRQRVKEALQKHNYQPNLAARGLAVGRTGVIGLVIPDIVSTVFTDPFFMVFVQGVTTTCNAFDTSMMLWLTEPEYEQRTIRQILHNGLLDGVIITSARIGDPVVAALLNGNLPFVIAGNPPIHCNAHTVDVENRDGGYKATQYLIERGCQRVAALAGPNNMQSGLNRLNGYADALHDAGRVPDPALIEYARSYVQEAGYEAMQQLLPAHPDGVFASSDALAIGAIQAVNEAGLRVPQDISFIGFDDYELAEHSTPPLTTIHQPIFELGAGATQMLLDVIRNRPATPQQVTLSTRLVVRKSCR